MENLLNRTIEKFGKIDIFINNAGMGCPDGFLTINDNLWFREINVIYLPLSMPAISLFHILKDRDMAVFCRHPPYVAELLQRCEVSTQSPNAV